VSVRGGKRNKEREDIQRVFECVRGRVREIKRAGRERVRGRGGIHSGKGYMYEREREHRDSVREGEREREVGRGGERVRVMVRGMG